MNRPEDHRPGPPSVLRMAREWANVGNDVRVASEELALVLGYLDAANPFEDGLRVEWLSRGGTRHPATVRHRLSNNEWLLSVDSAIGPGHPARACSAEIAAPLRDLGNQAVPADRCRDTQSGPVEVCVDSAEENMVGELALSADHVLPDRWNGWARPVATASALADFLRRWRHNDPNGVWGEALELDGKLVCTRPDDEDEESFSQFGQTSDGLPLYDLTGWAWVQLPTLLHPDPTRS